LREAAGGRSELMIPHQSVAHCSKPRERNAGTVRRGKSNTAATDEDTQSTASASFLLAAATQSISLDKMSH